MKLFRKEEVGGRGQCGQATKGVWGMSWRQEAMKGVEDCDNLGGAEAKASLKKAPKSAAVDAKPRELRMARLKWG